jgi:hypothetical protein
MLYHLPKPANSQALIRLLGNTGLHSLVAISLFALMRHFYEGRRHPGSSFLSWDLPPLH